MEKTPPLPTPVETIFQCLICRLHCLLQPPASGKQSPTKNGSPSKCPRFLKVKNWETDVVLSDTLHLKSTLVSIPAWGETRLFSSRAISTPGMG